MSGEMRKDRELSPVEKAWRAFQPRWLRYLSTAGDYSIFAAGFSAGQAHASTTTEEPREPFVCDICGKRAAIGTWKADGSMEIRCYDHFPEVPDER